MNCVNFRDKTEKHKTLSNPISNCDVVPCIDTSEEIFKPLELKRKSNDFRRRQPQKGVML